MNLLFIVAMLAAGHPHVRMETSAGLVEIELDDVKAPATVANFLRYVNSGQYDGGLFHRTVTLANQPKNNVKIEVIQGGPRPDAPKIAPIALERTNATGLRHIDGAISMARDGPDTATGDFFICIGDQSSLDFGGARNPDGQGFAAFGKVVRGMEVVRKIQQSAAEGQKLTPAVKILKAIRLD